MRWSHPSQQGSDETEVHMIINICAAGDAETERNLIQLDESVEAVEYLAEPLQVAVSAVSVPMSEKVGFGDPDPASDPDPDPDPKLFTLRAYLPI